MLVEQLRRLDGETNRKKHLEKIIAAADAVITKIDTEALAKHYGIKLNSDDDNAQAERKKIDKKLNTLTDALYRKGRALGYQETQLREKADIKSEEKTRLISELKNKFESNFSELQKWAETKDDKFVLLHIRRENMHGRIATALKLLNEKIKRFPHDKKLYKKRIRLLGELEWDEWKAHEEKWQILRFPSKYQLF